MYDGSLISIVGKCLNTFNTVKHCSLLGRYIKKLAIFCRLQVMSVLKEKRINAFFFGFEIKYTVQQINFNISVNIFRAGSPS